MINFSDQKVKEHIAFQYLLTETQVSALILLELNIFIKSSAHNI